MMAFCKDLWVMLMNYGDRIRHWLYRLSGRTDVYSHTLSQTSKLRTCMRRPSSVFNPQGSDIGIKRCPSSSPLIDKFTIRCSEMECIFVNTVMDLHAKLAYINARQFCKKLNSCAEKFEEEIKQMLNAANDAHGNSMYRSKHVQDALGTLIMIKADLKFVKPYFDFKHHNPHSRYRKCLHLDQTLACISATLECAKDTHLVFRERDVA